MVGDEVWLKSVGGPEGVGGANAYEAAYSIDDFDGDHKAAYDSYLDNVVDTLGAYGFKWGTERGKRVLTKAEDAFDETYKRLTGFSPFPSNPARKKSAQKGERPGRSKAAKKNPKKSSVSVRSLVAKALR